MIQHPGHPPVEVVMEFGDWLGWFVGWVAGFYLDVVLVFCPFVIARVVLGRWPWPLREDDAKPNYGPMRPRDGMEWCPAPEDLPRSFYAGDDD